MRKLKIAFDVFFITLPNIKVPVSTQLFEPVIYAISIIISMCK